MVGSGVQAVTLDSGCQMNQGAVMHELGHVLGKADRGLVAIYIKNNK